MSTDVDYEREDANKALSLAMWSYLGLIVPLIGLILGGYSLSLVKGLPTEGKIGRKVKSARRHSKVAIFLSILIAVSWGVLYSMNVQAEKEAIIKQEQHEQEKKKQAEKEESDRVWANFQRKTSLDLCMSKSDEGYPWANMQADTKRDPYNTQQYVDLYYKMKGEAEASCQRLYSPL